LVENRFFYRSSYASAVLGVVILSNRPSVRLSVRPSHACFVTNPKNLPAYSCAAADKISTDLSARAVSLRQLSYLLTYPPLVGAPVGVTALAADR